MTIVTVPVYGNLRDRLPTVPPETLVNPGDWIEFVLGDEVGVTVYINKRTDIAFIGDPDPDKVFGAREFVLTPSSEGRRVRSPIPIGLTTVQTSYLITIDQPLSKGEGSTRPDVPVKGTITVGSGSAGSPL